MEGTLLVGMGPRGITLLKVSRLEARARGGRRRQMEKLVNIQAVSCKNVRTSTEVQRKSCKILGQKCKIVKL